MCIRDRNNIDKQDNEAEPDIDEDSLIPDSPMFRDVYKRQGVFCGIGYAMIYTRNSSTGGADFIIMAVKALRPHLSMGNISFLTDVGIILVGGLLFRDIDGMIYGMIVNILSAVVIDKMIYGMNSGKVAFIVTKNGKKICDVIDAVSYTHLDVYKRQIYACSYRD